MRVQMRTKISGTRDGADWPEIGDEITLPDDEGAALCATGLAAPVADPEPPKIEKRPAAKRAEKR